MRTYWMAFCNDGDSLFGEMRDTKAEALRDLKELFYADFIEDEEAAEYNRYYIEKCVETNDAVYVKEKQRFDMSMGARGSIKAERIKDAED